MTLHRRDLLLGLSGVAAVSLVPARGAAQAWEAAPKPDRELMVPVRGGRIYVRVNGDLAGPKAPLLMVHGGPGSGHSGFLPALALASDRAVILYDQLDNGAPTRRTTLTTGPSSGSCPRSTPSAPP